MIALVRSAATENKLFTWALVGGVGLRLLAMVGYPGALWFSGDSYVYLGAALRPLPDLSKSTGYSLFLRALLPFHSLTLVTALQHLMGLSVACLIYVLLRRSQVSKTWAAIATLPVLLDGYIIEDEHLIMAESLFTFLLMVAVTLLLWRPGLTRWWMAAIAGLLGGYAVVVRTEGAVMLAVLPLFLLLRRSAWKSLRGWLAAIALAVVSLVPVGAYAVWFHEHTGHYGMTMSTGFYLWGRVSSFADCARIQPTGDDALVCPTEPLYERTPPGDFVWHAPQTHRDMNSLGGPVSDKGNKVLTDFAIDAVEAQPLDYLKTVFLDTLLSFGFPRIGYPGSGTTYYYSFHLHYVTATYNMLPPKTVSWIPPKALPQDSAFDDWMNYGHQAPGVVHRVFAVPILIYQRVVYTYGPLLAVIFLVGLGGLLSVTAATRGNLVRWHRPVQALLSVRWRTLRVHWAPRGTTMLPWVTAVALLVTPIAVADFDYRYLLPVIPFACLAAGLAFAPTAKKKTLARASLPDQVETEVTDSVA